MDAARGARSGGGRVATTTFRLGDSQLVDRLTVVTRDTEVLYEGRGWTATRGEQGRAALREGMDRPPNTEQARAYLAQVEQLEPMHRRHTLAERAAREVWTQVLTIDVPHVRAMLVAREMRAAFPGARASARIGDSERPGLGPPGASRGRGSGRSGGRAGEGR